MLTKIYGGKIKKIRCIISIACLVTLVTAEILFTTEIQVTINFVLPIIETLLIKVSVNNNLKIIIGLYIFLYLINSFFTTVIVGILSLKDTSALIVELVVCANSAIIVFILSLSQIKNTIKYLISMIPKIVKILMLALLFFCFVLSLLFVNESVYITDLWTDTVKITMLLSVIILLISIPLIIVYSISNKYNKSLNESYQKTIIAEADHYKVLAKSNFELRQFKHNYKNTNIALMKLLSEGKSDEALKLIETQNQELDSTSVQFDTGNGIVDAMLTDKQNQADKINTTIKFEGAVPGNAIDAVDLCIIFGNPLDNAIEACAEIDANASKEIHISCVCNSGFAFIEITNPVQKKVEIRGNLPETTKPDKEMHGFGLYSLEKVIKKYDGEVTCECDETIFKLSMELNIPVKES